jgi:hypothetical protein
MLLWAINCANQAESLETTSVLALLEMLTGILTGTPTHISGQSPTPLNKIPLQEPLGGRQRTADAGPPFEPSVQQPIDSPALQNEQS